MQLTRFSAGVAFLAIAAGTLMITSPRSEAANDNNPTQDEKLKILITLVQNRFLHSEIGRSALL